MAAAPGIVTSGTGPPNAVVQIQPGMNVQAVVLVDQNGNYLTGSGSAATAGYLADLTGVVNVAAATAPTAGQVLTATGGSAATWQAPTGGAPTGAAGGALNGTYPNPGLATVPVTEGGTGGTTPTIAFGNLSPMTTLGDILFENATPAAARLGGNTASTKNFLTSTGVAGTAQAPAWGTIATSDLPVIPVSGGGTGGTTATAGYGSLSPMTTLGDIEYENATPAAARLAGNITTQKQFLSQTGNGGTSAAPAWSVVSGQYLCAPTQYAPSTQGSLITTSTTMSAVSSANINTGSFTAPPSGSVITTAAFTFGSSSASDEAAFGLALHGTTTMQGYSSQVKAPNATQQFSVIPFLVGGLTAGSAYTFDLMFCISNAGSLTVYAYGQSTSTPALAGTAIGGPVVMTVQAV